MNALKGSYQPVLALGCSRRWLGTEGAADVLLQALSRNASR